MRRDKRKICLTAAVVLILSLVLTAFAACSASPTYDLVKHSGEYGDSVFSEMQYFAQNYADRTMGTQGELDAAQYLAGRLSELGYVGQVFSDDGEDGLQSFKTNYTRFDGTAVNDVYAHNVVFKKKTDNSKGEIILAAQYDNLYQEKNGEELWKADGSYESGSGTAVLLTLAKLLVDVDCGYDITFAFFTGGSYCWQGAYYYVTQLKNAELANISLMLNFSLLGGGDNLYLYSSESSVDYGGYLTSAGVGLTQLPKDKNSAAMMLETDSMYAYSHIGMLGNQYFFMNRGVPTANYLSHNWSLNDYPIITEMKDAVNVYHTPDDTLEQMISRKGEESIKAMLSDVVNSVMNALDKDNAQTLDATLATAREQLGSVGQSDNASQIAAIAIKIVLVGVFFAIALTVRNYISKNRDKYLNPQEEKQSDVRPFDFDTYPKDENESGGNTDIFDGEHKNHSDDPFV